MSATLEPMEAVSASAGAGRWKECSAASAAIVLALIFLLSGLWKISDLEATSERMVQSLIPAGLSLPAAIAVSVCEIYAAVLLLVPRHRRWGAWLAAMMLIAFMIYIGVLYDRLLGEDCNCFPWLQRVVGPAFFAGDAAMLLLAGAAGAWSRKPGAWRQAAAALLAVLALAGVSFAVTSLRRASAVVPETITVDGHAFPLRRGVVLLYFFDPECSHCYEVAGEMGKWRWGATRVVVLATREPQFTANFLSGAGLKADVSPDADLLRKVLPFTDPPYAVALRHGRIAATFNSGQMEDRDYFETLKRLGFLK